MENKFNKALENYYKYKKKYYSMYEKDKQKIIDLKNDKKITLQEASNRIKQIKLPCIFCNKKVKTIFTKKNGVLTASCGDVENSCNKSIELKIPEYIQSSNLSEWFDNDIKELIREIINIKTKLLLNMDDKDSLISDFEDYMELYNDSHEINNRLKYKISKQMILFNNEELLEIENKMHDFKKNIKEIINKYNLLTVKNNKLLDETNLIYKDHILPLEEELNKLKFKSRLLEKNADGFLYLNTNISNLNEMETIADGTDPEIIKFDEPLYFDNQTKIRKNPKREKKEVNNE